MAGHRKRFPDELYVEIERMLTEEAKEIQENVNEAANIVTKDLLADIRADSPVDTGDYKKGWRRKKLKYHYTVYNKTHPQLTYLLEYGHQLRQGGRAEPKPHIKPNEEKAVDKFDDLCINIVSEGLRLK